MARTEASVSVIDRLGQVVRSEWNARFSRDDVDDDNDADNRAGRDGDGSEPRDGRGDRTGVRSASPATPRAPRGPAVSDVEGALRVLELSGQPTLDEVRAAYRRLARHYHPKTTGPRKDDIQAAHTVQEALTEALELLEEHLLPLPPATDGVSAR